MRDFNELKVWEKAHAFVLEVYRHTSSFPTAERFGLTPHLRKSATSVSSNIAEGCGRNSDRDFTRFLSIAAGSTSEAEYQIRLAADLGYISRENYGELDRQANEIKRMLNSMIQSLS